MPGGDGTGPLGMGSRTGRGAGICNGFSTPGYANPVGGRGFFGSRRGQRNMYYATGLPRWSRYNQVNYPQYGYTKEDELNALKNEAKYMNQNIEDINKRIQELESQKDS